MLQKIFQGPLFKRILRPAVVPVRRFSAVRQWKLRVATGEIDPQDWIALPLGEPGRPDAAFIPMLKAANTSIRHALKPCFGLAGQKVFVYTDPRMQTPSLKHVLDELVAGGILFTVTRHPATRIRSAFENKVRRANALLPYCHQVGIYPEMSFDAFLKVLVGLPELHLDPHFKPQTCLLHYAINDPRLIKLRFENLETEWRQLALKIGRDARPIPRPRLNLGHRNVTTKDVAPFTDQQKQLIMTLYGEDFDNFAYSWEGLDDRP